LEIFIHYDESRNSLTKNILYLVHHVKISNRMKHIMKISNTNVNTYEKIQYVRHTFVLFLFLTFTFWGITRVFVFIQHLNYYFVLQQWILNDVKKNKKHKKHKKTQKKPKQNVNFIQFKYNILNINHWNGVGYWSSLHIPSISEL
jgi:hypothetical protein